MLGVSTGANPAMACSRSSVKSSKVYSRIAGRFLMTAATSLMCCSVLAFRSKRRRFSTLSRLAAISSSLRRSSFSSLLISARYSAFLSALSPCVDDQQCNTYGNRVAYLRRRLPFSHFHVVTTEELVDGEEKYYLAIYVCLYYVTRKRFTSTRKTR